MSGTHGVFQHRTGYFYTILEEDFCEVYRKDGANEVCRAYITSILEHLTNKQYDATGSDEDIWVFMSLPEMSRRMRHACSERTIHKELTGMVKDGYLFKRRAVGKATMEYKLNLKRIRKALEALPDVQPCNSATYHLANLQDQSSNSARSTLQNDKINLANLQPRIPIDIPIEETKNTERTIATSAEDRHAPAANVHDIEAMRKRKTDPQLPAVKGNTHDLLDTPGNSSASTPGGIREDVHRSGGGDTTLVNETAYHIANSGYEKGHAHASSHPSNDSDVAALGRGNAPRMAVEHPHQIDDETPTEKRAAVKPLQHTPAASVSLSLAVTPRGGQDDTGGRQAIRSPVSLSTLVPAVSSGASLTGSPPASPEARQVRHVIPKRPLRKIIEKPQLTFAGQQLREWYECARECKVRMTDKNVITLNRLADIDEMTQENLRDVLELYDTDKWLLEHNVMVDLQELEKQDGKFTFERGLLAVKRKRRANAPAQNGKADVYGNDYSLAALLARQQKAM